MAETKIEWTAYDTPTGRRLGYTMNPWWGCTKVSDGCKFCYADALDRRTGGAHWGPGAERRRTSEKNWNEARRWNRRAAAEGVRPRVFCASMADIFDDHQSVAPEWRAEAFALMKETAQLDWVLVTKRPENMAAMLPPDWGRFGYPNVGLCVTVEDNRAAEARIPILLKTPAVMRGLSMEPLLEEVDMRRWLPTGRPAVRPNGEPFLADAFFMTECENCGWIGSSELCGTDNFGDDSDVYCPACSHSIIADEIGKLDWVKIGGESGGRARPFHVEWAEKIIRQCQASGTAVFMKQLGSVPFYRGERYGVPDRKGNDMKHWPDQIKVRDLVKYRATD